MNKLPSILQQIIEHKHEEVNALKAKISEQELISSCLTEKSKTLNFTERLESFIEHKKPAIIAEIKKGSPSKGIIKHDFNPSEIAKAYEKAGAACISVLTDEKFFYGAPKHLTQVRKVTSLPLLRKDFIISPYQIYQSRALGADCILLIVAALAKSQLHDFCQLAQELSLDVLVESHDENELSQALELPTKLIGINNRNLHTFETSLNTTLLLKDSVPKDKIIITESGISTANDINVMINNNIFAFLIGEALMKTPQNINEFKLFNL